MRKKQNQTFNVVDKRDFPWPNFITIDLEKAKKFKLTSIEMTVLGIYESCNVGCPNAYQIAKFINCTEKQAQAAIDRLNNK
jgi:hypothetical protein